MHQNQLTNREPNIRPNHVPEQINELHGRVQQIEELMLMVEEKLSPILTTTPEGTQALTKTDAEAYVPLAREILAANNVLARVKATQERILNNIQL